MKNKIMKTKEELQKYIREQISNPLIGQMIMDMTEEGVPYEDIMEMAKKLIENTPKIEKEMVETQLRVQDGERILSTIKLK
jgi:phosphoribosylformylglycinamidine (FGAM) synthase PurS component